MDFDYLYECQKARYQALSECKIPWKENLSAEIYEDCYLLPVRSREGFVLGVGGVADKERDYVSLSGIRSGGGRLLRPLPIDQCEYYMGEGYDFDSFVEANEDELVYLGYLFNHWGHFLIDLSTRLWYLLKYGKDKKCVFLVREHKEFKINPNIRRFLELLDIPLDNIRFVNEVTRCRRLIIPEPSYITNVYVSREYAEMFEYVARQAQTAVISSHEKVYFTRNQFKKAKESEVGEELLLDFSEANGYYTAAPERLTLDEQIALIRNSRSVAAISGSITHSFLFAAPGTDQEFLIFNKTYVLNAMQMDVNQMKGLRVKYIDAYLSPMPVTLGNGPFLFSYTEPFQKYVRDSKSLAPSKELTEARAKEDRLRQYVVFYKKKLEMKYQEIPLVEDALSVHDYDRRLVWEFLNDCVAESDLTQYSPKPDKKPVRKGKLHKFFSRL